MLDYQQTLSTVIITFNEEKNIERCLRSVLDVSDEIIVVDSFSQDNTEKICLSFPKVKFIKNKFVGHIQQKNFAKDQASLHWILSLDADEVLSQELIDSIKLWKQRNEVFEAACLNRINFYCGQWVKHSGWYPDWKLRIWKNGSGHWAGENPHDRFELFDQTQPTSKLSGQLLHFSYHNVEDHYKQVFLFSDIASESLYLKKKKYNFTMKYLSAMYKWFYCYILRLGFLDGKVGWQIARISAHANYLKYYKLELKYRQSL